MKIYEADILLVYPPHKKITFVSSIPHLSAYAKKKGYIVDALDAPTLKLSIQDIINYIHKTKPKSIGVSIPFTPLAIKGLELIKEIKSYDPNIPIIVGGVHPTLCPNEFKGYATVCIGDGEIALVRFLRNLYKDKMWNIETPILNIPTPIDEMKTPDWSVIESDKYKLVLPTGEKGFPVQTSIGCIFNCIFCSSKVLFNGNVRFKNMIQIDREIMNGIKQFGTRNIIFRDENFTLNRERFEELCKYLKYNNIKWWCQTRANMINEDLSQLAKDSGCLGISIGIETGDPYILKRIKKGITLEDGIEAFRVLKKVGLKSAVNFMIGFPWDNIETLNRTLNYADKIDADYFGLQISTPFPKTELREIILESGYPLKENWDNYNTSKGDNYIPPELKGYNLLALRDFIEWNWFIRNPKRFFKILFGKGNLKYKFRFVKRMIKIYKNQRNWLK